MYINTYYGKSCTYRTHSMVVRVSAVQSAYILYIWLNICRFDNLA